MLAAPCPPLAHASALPAMRAPLHADVDGDGRRDVVAIRVARGAPVGCGVLLTVRTRGGTHAARIFYGSGKFATAGALVRNSTYPFVNAAYALDRRRGLELVVTSWEGASNSFLQLYSWRHGRLVRLRLPGNQQGLSWGGFAAAYGGIDCDHGKIRATRAWFVSGRRWGVGRTFYTVGERSLRLVRSQTFHGGIRLTERFSRELVARFPLASCRGVRGRRQL
jgi:hypothetical protein